MYGEVKKNVRICFGGMTNDFHVPALHAVGIKLSFGRSIVHTMPTTSQLRITISLCISLIKGSKE